MKYSAWIAGINLAVWFVASFDGQAAPSESNLAATNVAGFTNLDFELGAPGEPPPGWSLPKVLAAQGFSAILTTNQPNHGQQCAEIRWPKERALLTNSFGNLRQSVDATPWRGQRIKVTAAIRVASAEHGPGAQMWLRVDRPGGGGAFDNMDDRPVRQPTWADYTITADVAEDAQKLNLGLITVNGATAWWDHVRIEILRRPQTPKPPFPYHSEEVRFENARARVTLAGTLTRPDGSGPFPALVLISGSGPQDRDETLFGHKPFAVIADFLSRNGWAILRYDDRGFGKSSGDFGSATSEDFSYDAEAAWDYLKSRPEIDPKRIGFLGHSEGGLIAPMIAARRTDVGFVILLAAPGISGDELLLAQAETRLHRMRFGEEYIALSRPLRREMIRRFRSNPSLSEKASKPEEGEPSRIALAGEKDMRVPDQLEKGRAAGSEMGLARIQSPWMQFLLRYDPVADFQRVKCPVLALNGQRDTQVLASQNLPAIEKNLKAGGNPRVTIKELQGLNHLFQTAPTGDLKEYDEIEESFSPAALAEMLDWLRRNSTR